METHHAIYPLRFASAYTVARNILLLSISFSAHNSIEFIPEEELLVTTVIDATLRFSKIAVPLYTLFSTI